MPQEMDISWQVLRRIVRDWAGERAELAEVIPLDGGTINTTLSLKLEDGARAVLKISTHRVDRSYAIEAHQLDLMGQAGVPVPRVYATKIGTLDDPHSYLLMEFIDGVDLAEVRRHCVPDEFDVVQCHLAEVMSSLHQRRADRYGRVRPEGFAGPENDPELFDTWPAFYRHAFDNLWHDVELAHLLPPRVCKQIDRVHEKLDVLLAHDDGPRLTHWDAWSSNILCRQVDGRWRVAALLDPNCVYAHVEAELAYLEQFKTVTPAFFKTYLGEGRKLPEEYYRVRKPVYQLYAMINDVHLFGENYVKPLMQCLERVAPLV